jgi:hypothetical protein
MGSFPKKYTGGSGNEGTLGALSGMKRPGKGQSLGLPYAAAYFVAGGFH